jgi:hypothetical protein
MALPAIELKLTPEGIGHGIRRTVPTVWTKVATTQATREWRTNADAHAPAAAP